MFIIILRFKDVVFLNSFYKQGFNRNQLFFASFDSFIAPDSPARVIDAFVDSIDISNFKYAKVDSVNGNKPYDPRTLLKIYLLGYFRKIRSSRKIEKALSVDLEFIWISNFLHIKHTTIADFRSSNSKVLKKVMIDFNLSLKDFDLISNIDSTDGTKVKAVNSKDNNFTLSKLDDRIALAKKSVEEFESKFDSLSSSQENEELKNLINEYNCKIEKLENLRSYMEDNNISQISLTDPDSKLMKNNGKFEVCYNDQVCVDTKSHIVKDFLLSNNPADVGSICPVSSSVKKIYNQDIVINITDKGYDFKKDMIDCLENGIIPEVTPKKNCSSFTLETDFEDTSISSSDISSTDPVNIKKCLRAGVIPDCYKDKISSIEVVDKYISVDDDNLPVVDDTMTEDEKRNFAMENNCFVRDLKSNKVFCPMGEILRQKSTNNNKQRYCNKLACKNCKNPCCSSKYKAVDFSSNQIFYALKGAKKIKKKKVKVKKVIIILSCDYELLKLRMGTSEHPHAQLKFWDDSRFLLLKGIVKATAELALYYCASNIRRAINIVGSNKLIEYFKNKCDSIIENLLYFLNFLAYFYNFLFFSFS